MGSRLWYDPKPRTEIIPPDLRYPYNHEKEVNKTKTVSENAAL